jgi:exodeoxyribonuclease III
LRLPGKRVLFLMMKLISWNVNGIRAALNKGILDWITEQSPDAICFQEVKARQDQILEEDLSRIMKYYPYISWNPAIRPGYSGVATLTSTQPIRTQFGLGIEEFDQEGRVIRLQYPQFELMNIYFPHGQHDHNRVPFKLDFYAALLDLCDQIHSAGESIILCGDFNTAHQEIDLRNPKENENTSGFLPEERLWIDRFLEHGFRDVYRALYPGRIQYTWWAYRFNSRQRGIGWRLDYFLVSEKLIDKVQDIVIHEEVQGSDHCPVALMFKS